MLNQMSTSLAFFLCLALSPLVSAQLQLPTEYPYCNVVAMQWAEGNGPYSVSIVGPSGQIYQSYDTHETWAHWGVTLDPDTPFNVQWSNNAGEIISSDQFTVIAGPSGCIVVDKGSWQSECESTEEHEEDGQVVTVTQTITAPTPVVTRTVCGCEDDDDYWDHTVTVTRGDDGESSDASRVALSLVPLRAASVWWFGAVIALVALI